MSRLYAQIIIPRPLEGTFTYAVPEAMRDEIAAGQRVIVPFGPKRFLTGIVESVSPVRPTDVAQIKDIEQILSRRPAVIHPQIKLWHWLADYYMCSVGDVFKAAVPAGLKVESESRLSINPELDPETAVPDTVQAAVMALLRDKGSMSVKDLRRQFDTPGFERLVTGMVDAGLLVVTESLVNRYRRHKVQYVVPAIERGNGEAVQRAFESVRRSPGQEKALIALVSLSRFNNAAAPLVPVAKSTLLEAAQGATWENVTALKRKGLVEILTREVSRFSADDDTATGPDASLLPQLTEHQQEALDAIHRSMADRNVTLLHGVTSSGKTELYIHLIDYVLRQGRQALFLVPEIALTTQLTRRLQKVFGRLVRIYHSRFSDSERVDIWRDMLEQPGPCVVIGARSAVFLPFTSLGLVIVDEEHDPSYKQSDPAPRYNGRDAAIVLASLHGAKVLLGSATPSVETYYKATEGGKYGLVSLTQRYGDVQLPEIELVDMNRERERNACDGALANRTIAAGRHLLREGRQLIVFHNRRGFSPRARCTMCQFVPKCDYCDVALTYHRRTGTLECHYCGASYPLPRVCPNCHEPAIKVEGYGTERVEDEVSRVFPEARVMRMDLDTTRNKDAYAGIIDDFSAGKADILVGTQMVTKGLDFGAVGLVTVVNADNVLHYPDFRSAERAFCLLEQVAGRAGRRADAGQGKVMVQTYSPDHPVLAHVLRHDYAGFYAGELAERRKFTYPPFARIINVYVRHRERDTVARHARLLADALRVRLGNRVNGPVEPSVERIASQYIRLIMLRIEPTASVSAVKSILREEYVRALSSPELHGLSVHFDVDPM